jgi:hypothetical protein
VPAHNRPNTAPLDAYLGRILLAAVKQAGGELRIPCASIDAVDQEENLVKDYDASTNTLVLRSCGRFTEVWSVRPEASAWIDQTRPADLAAVAARSSVKTDDELAALEERLQRKPFRRSVPPRPTNSVEQ